jgi:hypothetical protein
MNDTAHLSAAAQREWGEHVENVMRGLAHALNNRAAALAGVVDVANNPDAGQDAGSILGEELGRVQELVAVVRSIGAPPTGPETFAPADAAREALAILALHADQRDHSVSIEAASTPPTRVPRWMFVRSLVALAASAAHGAADTKAPVVLSIAQSGDWVIVRAEGSPTTQISPLTTELARAMGGDSLGSQLGFRVPTLAAVRRREGR